MSTPCSGDLFTLLRKQPLQWTPAFAGMTESSGEDGDQFGCHFPSFP